MDREGCWGPARLRRVTSGAIIRYSQGWVIWICGLIKVSGVTIDAKRGGAGIAINMAAGALNGRVCSRQREVGGIMIKTSRLPGRLRMARGTFGRVASCLVIWISGGIVILDVATGTGIRRIGVISIMTASAIIGNSCMSTH